MPTASVSNPLFDIQIRVHTSKRLSVLQVVFSLFRMVPNLIATTMKTLQETWMREDLGPHGTVGNLFEEPGCSCPSCGSHAVNRKDWKTRTPIVPMFGEIEVPQRRVTCRECGSIYRPYEELLGLPRDRQYTMAALVEGIRAAVVCSYERAASLSSSAMSPKTLWRAVQRTRPNPSSENEEHALVVMDATQVPKWKESGQITLTLAHEVSRGPVVDGRSTLDRAVVAVAAGKEEDIKECLKDPTIQGLMHDGKLEVEGLCEREGRCMWHVPYTVKHLLYQDGIKGEANNELRRECAGIMFDESLDPSERETQFTQWVEENKSEAPQSTTHVQNALDGIRNTQQHEELFEVRTTAPMERQMKEVNKRFENGGGWTQRGAESLLWHCQLWLIEPEKWRKNILPNDGPAWPELFQNSLI